ncbi:P-loop containing nucleoside triphosphate hydrolase protein [Trichoderma austrokoningii]
MMDYHAIHGYDIASFGIPSSTHRLPTVPASQALEGLKADPAAHISTGLAALDRALLGLSSEDSQDAVVHGGVKRGQVTEIWGSPGCGKTAMGMQLAANALSDGNRVVWVDCFQKFGTERMANVLKSVKESRLLAEKDNVQDIDPAKLVHYSCMKLPHLLGFLSRPTTTAIAADVSLIVISSLWALINSSLPKSMERTGGKKPAVGLSKAAKRLQGLQFIITALQKLAGAKNCAVVILSQSATLIRSGHLPALVPSINVAAWEQGVATRIVLFRDWAWKAGKSSSVWLAGLQRIDGRATQDAVEHISAFKVESAGISSVHYKTSSSDMEAAARAPLRKRKLGQTDLEVPDSDGDDEDYDWVDDDDALPPPPSQWQGSEDLILGENESEVEEWLQEWYYEDDEAGDGDRSNNET